jgi:hypothetical protein
MKIRRIWPQIPSLLINSLKKLRKSEKFQLEFNLNSLGYSSTHLSFCFVENKIIPVFISNFPLKPLNNPSNLLQPSKSVPQTINRRTNLNKNQQKIQKILKIAK